jgi:hypothetical protein
MLRADEYTIPTTTGVEDGPCMLRSLISVVSIETRATISCVRAALKRLPELMEELKSDITGFNLVVSAHVDTLRAVDEKCEDLLTDIFAAYQTASDKTFVRYIADKESQWEDNTIDYTPEQFMQLAKSNYKTKFVKKTWNAPSREETELIALQATTARGMAELVALQATAAGRGGRGGGRGSGRGAATGRGGRGSRPARHNSPALAWKNVAPTGNEPRRKTFNGKEYIYCPNHGETKWVLATGHSDGCRLAPEDGAAATPSGALVPNQRVMQYAQALMHAMENSGESEVEGIELEDEEI